MEQARHTADDGPAPHHGHRGGHGHLGQQGVPDLYHGQLLSRTVSGDASRCEDHYVLYVQEVFTRFE